MEPLWKRDRFPLAPCRRVVNTRKALLQGLGEKGFGFEQLGEIGRVEHLRQSRSKMGGSRRELCLSKEIPSAPTAKKVL